MPNRGRTGKRTTLKAGFDRKDKAKRWAVRWMERNPKPGSNSKSSGKSSRRF